jgi:hypothetical protein
VEAALGLEPLAGEAGGGGRSGGGVDAAEGGVGAVQTFTPVALVAKTGRPMWSARTKEMVPPSITAIGSHPFQTYSRIRAPEGCPQWTEIGKQ